MQRPFPFSEGWIYVKTRRHKCTLLKMISLWLIIPGFHRGLKLTKRTWQYFKDHHLIIYEQISDNIDVFCDLPSFFCTQYGVWGWNDKLTFTAWLAVSSQRLTGNWLKMVGYPSTNWRDTHQLTFSTKRGLLVKIIHSLGLKHLWPRFVVFDARSAKCSRGSARLGTIMVWQRPM